MESEKAKQGYDQKAQDSKTNDQLRKSNPSTTLIDTWTRNATYLCLTQYISEKDRIADLGCHRLGVMPTLMRLGISFYLGVDISKECLKIGQERMNSLFQQPPPLESWVNTRPSLQHKLVPMDLCKQQISIDKENEKMNVVLCLNALHFLPVETIIKNVSSQLLLSGGYFILLCLDADTMEKQLRDSKDTSPYPDHFIIRDKTATEYLMVSTGMPTLFETRIWKEKLIKHCKAVGLTHQMSRSVYEIYTTLRVQPKLNRKLDWINHNLGLAEQAVLQLYHIHVFRKS